MAILVLVSALSFSVQHHFCGDTLVDSAIFTETKKCCPDSKISQLSMQQQKGCCEDKQEIVEGIDILKLDVSNENSTESEFQLLPILNVYKDLDVFSVSHETDSFCYSPPDLILNLTVYHQVFLI